MRIKASCRNVDLISRAVHVVHKHTRNLREDLPAIFFRDCILLGNIHDFTLFAGKYKSALNGFKNWLAYVISIDAILVLSGAVLTSFVGVSGLMKRTALDRILPQFFLKENKKQSNYRILISFFLLCIPILVVTNGELEPLAGVYTISFLIVIGLLRDWKSFIKNKAGQTSTPRTRHSVCCFYCTNRSNRGTVRKY